ncbi:hypothetical protein OSCT_0327 [Oscillochloris trichoides DG-6]|uniref:Uncharacterized protein n=1 Tax=Oscillochloris trichoides DG-6 TaxID=765420 RepID=E1IAH6_9CHLR|nr:hypothetical protein OSCT_0327 [Oscillochloris trichoides DG-6]
MFQSAGRIWGFWNFLKLGTLICFGFIMFQSAGRIWGFWNPDEAEGQTCPHNVSIRRADLGLLERTLPWPQVISDPVSIRRADLGLLERFHARCPQLIRGLFQSAGRIWGFWNLTKPSYPRVFRCQVSIRRADLGLFGTAAQMPLCLEIRKVSIRRADLGLLERSCIEHLRCYLRTFQSAGRIWGFWNYQRMG